MSSLSTIQQKISSQPNFLLQQHQRPFGKRQKQKPAWITRLRDFIIRMPPPSRKAALRRQQGRGLVTEALALSGPNHNAKTLPAWKTLTNFCHDDRMLLRYLFNTPIFDGKTALRWLLKARDVEVLRFLRPHLPVDFHYDRDAMAVSPSYIGEWAQGTFGVLDYPDGSYYAGQMYLRWPDGRGILTKRDGSKLSVIAHRHPADPKDLYDTVWECPEKHFKQ